jgi:hypothetical protein
MTCIEEKKLSQLKSALDEALMALVGTPELVNAWWSSPNKAFDMQTPEEVYDVDPNKVRNYIVGALMR